MSTDAATPDDESPWPATTTRGDLSTSGAPGEFVPPDALTLETLAELERVPEQRTWVQSALLLAVSLALFAFAGFFENTPVDLALTIGVLLFHELGHYFGMRVFNYQDVRMFFIPLFGAAVAGRSRSVLGYQEAIVLLLGPLPGIAIGTALGLACLTFDSNLLRSAALLLLVINAFNLLPIMPLDGGRLLHLVLFSRQPLLEAIFRVVAAGLLIWIGWASSSWILAGLGIFMITGTPQTYRVSRLAHQLRGPLLVGNEMDLTAHIPRDQAVPLVELVRQKFPQVLQPKLLASTVRQVWERIHLRPPGIAASLGLLALALAGFLAAPIALFTLNIPVTEVATRINADGSTTPVLEVRVWGHLRQATELNQNHLPHGRHLEYHPNTRRIRIEGAYKEGQMDGAWTEFSEDGQVVSVRHYREGELIQLQGDDMN